MLKHGILGLLNYGDATGYEIRELFRNSLNYFWTAQSSQIYRELQTLEKNNWAVSTLIKQIGKPDKKIFHITNDGRNEFIRWLSEDDSLLIMRTPLLMKVFFFGERSINENIEFFEGFKQQIENYLDNLEQAHKNVNLYSENLEDKNSALYWQMTVSFGIKNLKTYIEWADECIKILEESK